MGILNFQKTGKFKKNRKKSTNRAKTEIKKKKEMVYITACNENG